MPFYFRVINEDPLHVGCLPVYIGCLVELKKVTGEASLLIPGFGVLNNWRHPMLLNDSMVFRTLQGFP